MRATIKGVKISAICSVVPSNVSKFEDELKFYPFSEQSSLKLAKVMGFKEHRIANADTTLCDLAAYGLKDFFEKNVIKKDEIDALIFVSHQHEYPVPGNSKVLHGMLELSKNTHCIDLYENCSGYISGLHNACSLINSSGFNKVILITANAGTCHLNIRDRNTYPLMGDAASVTLIEKSDKDSDSISFVYHHDGSYVNTLIVPAGGMRKPADASTAVETKDNLGNYRSENELHMDGANVFHFVMDNVPPAIHELREYTEIKEDQIDYHITHQPNKFLVDKLTELLKVDPNKVFNNIVENFGNSSSSTIPVTICFNLKKDATQKELKLCLSAFGAGMSVGCALCNVGPLTYCNLIEHPGK